MATTASGIYYPDANGIPSRNSLKQIADSVQTYIDGTQAAWTPFIPAWTAATTAPALNNGTLIGRYTQVGKTVTMNITLTCGSTTTYGTGVWSVSVPLPAGGPSGARWAFYGHARDSSASIDWPVDAMLIQGQSTALLRTWTATAGSNNLINSSGTVPFTWAVGDILTINGTYETT